MLKKIDKAEAEKCMELPISYGKEEIAIGKEKALKQNG